MKLIEVQAEWNLVISSVKAGRPSFMNGEKIENRSEVKSLKEKLADEYLIRMGVTREALSDYLTVISAARKGECPEEYTEEKF